MPPPPAPPPLTLGHAQEANLPWNQPVFVPSIGQQLLSHTSPPPAPTRQPSGSRTPALASAHLAPQQFAPHNIGHAGAAAYTGAPTQGLVGLRSGSAWDPAMLPLDASAPITQQHFFASPPPPQWPQIAESAFQPQGSPFDVQGGHHYPPAQPVFRSSGEQNQPPPQDPTSHDNWASHFGGHGDDGAYQ
ncbi:hypothetical protein JCM10908_006639 [Rhodotorula pacifica]|uniref:uncharacterized protein n=1 Tax=Rhodotorula pacifica TaxID=1495444 RepID=UPI003176E672